MAQPRPDLAGLRVKSPGHPAIYLIDPEGYRRWIPDPDTYNNLFRSWDNIVEDLGVFDISEGTALTSGAVLARPRGAAPVYLVSNGVKRWVTSPAVMDRYHFEWQRIHDVPHVLTDFIPEGHDWG